MVFYVTSFDFVCSTIFLFQIIYVFAKSSSKTIYGVIAKDKISELMSSGGKFWKNISLFFLISHIHQCLQLFIEQNNSKEVVSSQFYLAVCMYSWSDFRPSSWFTKRISFTRNNKAWWQIELLENLCSRKYFR